MAFPTFQALWFFLNLTHFSAVAASEATAELAELPSPRAPTERVESGPALDTGAGVFPLATEAPISMGEFIGVADATDDERDGLSTERESAIDLSDSGGITPTSRVSRMITSTTHVLAPYPRGRTPNRPIFILAIDGGGIRGCIPSEQLCYLDNILRSRHNLTLARIFDVISGTSTGGLIAAALGMSKSDGVTPAMTMAEIDGFYTAENSSRIFSSTAWHRFRTWGGIWGPRYQPLGLEDLLRENMGDAWLSQTTTNVQVTAVNMDTDEIYTFRRDQARESAAMDFRLADICRATSAAPTFFPGAMIRDRERSPHAFIDGGVRKNNPAGLALDLAEELYPRAPAYILLSLGTGEKPTGEHGFEETADSGKLGWARPLIDIMMYGSSRDTHTDVSRRLPPRVIGDRITLQYQRTQVLLPEGLSAMDTTDPTTIRRLRELGNPIHNREIRTTLDNFADTVGRFFPTVATLT